MSFASYIRAGRSYERVSTVLNANGFAYTGPVAASTVARDRGTALHEDIASFFAQTPSVPGRDMHLFHAFLRDKPHYRMDMFETPVFSDTYGVAGTLDALFYDTERNVHVLVDWKRAKYLYHESAQRYQMQLSMYSLFLLEDRGITVSDMYLVLLHSDNATYKMEQVPYLDPTTLLGANLLRRDFGDVNEGDMRGE